MLSRIKNYFWIALALAAFYFLLSHHIIFSGMKEFDLLKKRELTLEYTFFNLKQANPYDVLKIKVLRDAGIENIMLDRGLISEQRLDVLLERIDSGK